MCGRLSCVVHEPIYRRFMGCTVNGFLSTIQPLYTVFRMLCNNADAHISSMGYLWYFWAEHFKDIFRMISHKHPVNKNLINLNPEIIYDIY